LLKAQLVVLIHNTLKGILIASNLKNEFYPHDNQNDIRNQLILGNLDLTKGNSEDIM